MSSESLKEQLKGLAERDLLVLDILVKKDLARVDHIQEMLPEKVNLSTRQIRYILNKLVRRGIICVDSNVTGYINSNGKQIAKAKWWMHAFLSKAKIQKYKRFRKIR